MNESTAAALAQLSEPLRSRLALLLEATGEAVWIGSGRRTTQQQADVRRKNCGPTFYDIWQKPPAACSPTTAIPGTSPHERGEAADLEGDLGLVARLLKQFGLATPVRGEPWHVEADDRAAGPGPGLELPGPIDDIFGGAGDLLADVVEPLVAGLGRVALVGILVAGGAALVVAGAVRGTRAAKLAGPALSDALRTDDD